jgi:predicted ATPase
MQLSEITISGYKSILNQNIRFGELNILIGANSSGKSNFIGVFGLIGEILNGNLQMTVAKGGGADKFLHYGKKTYRFYRDILHFWAEWIFSEAFPRCRRYPHI